MHTASEFVFCIQGERKERGGQVRGYQTRGTLFGDPLLLASSLASARGYFQIAKEIDNALRMGEESHAVHLVTIVSLLDADNLPSYFDRTLPTPSTTLSITQQSQVYHTLSPMMDTTKRRCTDLLPMVRDSVPDLISCSSLTIYK